ncbi:MAG TPA: PP2C family protein-serine/threonine phosphatase, partial [Herpetosiphonaceae bacterium]|nr:PP2C family protein-serine/threonine phosphatase [Herpetosiphonaceae bacterium]
RDHLEEQVAERTTALRLTNERLQQLASELSEKNTYLQEGLALAHDIQLGLLPDRPPWETTTLSAFGFSVPSAEVGGDFYTFIASNAGRHSGVAIGDISGKGVGAALMMALTSSTLEERARDGSLPAALLADMNDRLLGRLQANKMNAALLYAVFDHQRDVLHIANAGMIAPLLLRDGKTQYIDVYGLPLGSLRDQRYRDLEMPVLPGDIIVLVSDGVVEARNDQGEMFGFERLEELLLDCAAYPTPETAVNALLTRITTFMGRTEQHDDITVVWLQVPPQPDRPRASAPGQAVAYAD